MSRTSWSAGLGATAVLLATTCCGIAGAVPVPVVDGSTKPPAGRPGPSAAMVQERDCRQTGVLPHSDPDVVNANVEMLGLSSAWRFSRGRGQTVAVIGSGVRPGPRLPDVRAGGDFVGTTDGLLDCDGNGTLIAGLIAGRPGDDGFSGVAPEAAIVSIRQGSGRFGLRERAADPVRAAAVVAVATLARSIVRAADLGAGVIDVSSAICLPASMPVDQGELGAALRYAVQDRDALVIAGAGDDRPGTGARCAANPLSDPAGPADPRNWAAVGTVSVPSWWQPYVLSVGSVAADGSPSTFTAAGPWVGVAAPGERVASVGNSDGGVLADALPGDRGELAAIDGTEYAAAYVAGVAALVRSRYPALTARQVAYRIITTARAAGRAPSNTVGAGLVDPVAALTWDVASARAGMNAPPRRVAMPQALRRSDGAARRIAVTCAGLLGLATIAVLGFCRARSR